MLELTSPHWATLQDAYGSALLPGMSSIKAVDDFLGYSSER